MNEKIHMKIKDVTCIQPLKKHINKMRKFDTPHRNTSTVPGINNTESIVIRLKELMMHRFPF